MIATVHFAFWDLSVLGFQARIFRSLLTWLSKVHVFECKKASLMGIFQVCGLIISNGVGGP
ncbi:hypothetical protein QQP08_019067 [Theobroma cacao]|nr:hypothetical protein QQP08_019067 [Theobroma cacao]